MAFYRFIDLHAAHYGRYRALADIAAGNAVLIVPDCDGLADELRGYLRAVGDENADPRDVDRGVRNIAERAYVLTVNRYHAELRAACEATP